jgi:hypothetical protein
MKEQIKEIAKVLCEKYDTEHCKVCDHNGRCMVRLEAELVYEAGYRKQSEGGWEHINGNEHICKNCSTTFYGFVYDFNFCPYCGAHMKGADT